MTKLSIPAGMLSLAAAFLAPCALSAQLRESRVLRLPPSGGEIMWTRAADRAVIGVTLGAGSAADTAGVALEAVDANGPAAEAGLEAGDRITAINGVSLKVAREDAEDLALTGLAQRRLQRVLSKVRPGDEVFMQVRSRSESRTVMVKTVSAVELERRSERRVPIRGRELDEESAGSRGMVGVSIGAAGNLRDTLGLFVSRVVSGGPAERAGIIEGERIAAVNGIDVRVPREDVEDPPAASARADRFVREVQKVAPGQAVTLRVFGNGRYREVAVTAVRASELPSTGFGVNFEDGEIRIMTPQAPRSPRATWTPSLPGAGPFRLFRRNGGEIEWDGERLRESLEDMRRTLQENFRETELELMDSGTVLVPARRLDAVH